MGELCIRWKIKPFKWATNNCRNEGFKTHNPCHRIIYSESVGGDFNCTWTPGQMSSFKYDPDIWCDVESNTNTFYLYVSAADYLFMNI